MNILILLYAFIYPIFLGLPITEVNFEHASYSEIEMHLTSDSEKKRRDKIVQFARKLKGTNYKYGGRNKKGFDCSGLAYYVFGNFGIKLDRSSGMQARQGTKKPLDQLEPADLLFFGNKGKVNHVGIVLKATKHELLMIHSSSSKGVIIENVYLSSYWKNRLLFAKEILTF